MLWGSRFLILGLTLTAVLGAALFTWLQRPVFESTTTLQIQNPTEITPSLLTQLSPILMPGGSGGMLDTDLAVLQSRQVAEGTVDSLALQVRLLEPDSSRQAIFRVITAPHEAPRGVYEFIRTERGEYTLLSGEGGAQRPGPESVEIGDSVRLGETVVALNPALRRDPPARIRIAVVPYRAAVAAVQKELEVASPAPQIASIAYRSTDPFLAAAVPNAVVSSFVQYRSHTNRSENSSAVNFLADQVDSYGRQLREAEVALQRYREAAQVVSPEQEASENVRRLAELQAQRDQLRAERDALANLIAQVRSRNRADNGSRSPYRQLASYPEFLTNRAVQDILQTLTDLENQRAELLVRRTSESLDVRGIDSRIAELEEQLYQTATNYLDSQDNQLQSLNASLARFGSQLEAIPAREVTFARLTRQEKLLEQLYTLLQTRLKEKQIQEAAELGDVRIIDPALVPEKPVYPKPVLNLLAAVGLGLLTGIALAFLRRSLDTKVRTPGDVESVAGDFPLLGTIPHIRPQPSFGTAKREVASGWKGLLGRPRSTATGLVTRDAPSSPASEAYRTLRTTLALMNGTEQPRVLVFTSATPDEGKSMSASNLAITLAQQQIPTLLVDADLRRGSLHERFATPREPGFSDVLRGDTPLNEALRELSAEEYGLPLYFLSSGTFPPNPAELLGSDRMGRFCQEARDRFRAVIFDAPPLNLFADAAALGREADATILITRAGVTEKRALEQAAAQLQRLGASGGVVLNGVASNGDYEHYYACKADRADGARGVRSGDRRAAVR